MALYNKDVGLNQNPIIPIRCNQEVIMKKLIMTLLGVCSILVFVSGAAIAGGEGGHHGMGKSESMMEGRSGAVFHRAQRLSQLIGAEVVNNQGENLGHISDLIAGEDGRLSYLVLVKGGMLWIGNELVAIPISALAPKVADDDKYVINLDKQTLEGAPTFTASNYPDFSNKQWQGEVRGYFGSKGTGFSRQDLAPEALED
jgi:sporulation protein YlmC with PRC-barrel domain